jgi:hypothetical protein
LQLSKAELANANKMVAANFGKAVEREVADSVKNSVFLKHMVTYTSRPFVKGPDFMSKFSGNVYDVTTRGTQWGADHFNRGYDGALKLIDYVRPTGFKF